MTTLTQDQITAFENGAKAMEALKSEILPLKGKFDAFDQTKFQSMEKSIGDAIEMNQKAEAARKALEDQNAALATNVKELATELTEVKTAFNRQAAAGASSDTPEQKAKEIARKRNKLFNEFARLTDDENKVYFDNHLKRNVTDENELKAMSVNSDPNGGYLVMPEFGGVIQTKVYETSPIRQLASVITVGTDTFEVLTDNDQAAFSWVGETQTRSETGTPTLGKIVIPVNEMAAKPKVTQKMLDDSSIDVEAWLAGKVGEIMARGEATSFVSGNGVNKPKGLLSYTAGTDITQQQVAQIGSGSSGAFTYSGLVSLQSSLKEPYQANAGFLIQRSSNFNIMTIVDGQSRPIFNLAYDKNVGLEPTILGKPVRFAADIPSAAANALAAIYGDIREAYQIVDRMGIRVLRDPYSEKPFIQFYTTRRVGGAVKNFEAYVIQKLQ